ncbi:hypothetical protein AD998_08635 [bacterium 336/3]|nr:hypothetical protein AD998_08635 [bacterium 336/3]
MSFQFSQNNQTNFTNTTTEKDPYPTWMPKYIVQEGDDFWKIARKMYPDLPDDKIAIKVKRLQEINSDKKTLKVGDALNNLSFVEWQESMGKSISKKTASVFDTVEKGKKKTLGFLAGKEDETKNKAVKSVKANPQETQAKKAASKATTDAVKNMKPEEEEESLYNRFDNTMRNWEFGKKMDASADEIKNIFGEKVAEGKEEKENGWFNKLDNAIKNSELGKKIDASTKAIKGKGGGTQEEGIIVDDDGAKFDGQDAHLAKAKHLWGHADWGALSLMQMALGIELPETQLSRGDKYSILENKLATIINTGKDYQSDIGGANEESEKEALQNAELEKNLKTMFKLYEELKPLGYGLQNLECSFPSEDIKEFDKGEKVQNFEQVKSFAEKNNVFILDVQFRNLQIQDKGNMIPAGHLSTPVMIKILKAIKAKKGALNLAEYNKIINQ